MLSAIALGRIAFGMALIVAFSFGLALVLIAIGLLVIYAKGRLDRLPRSEFAMKRLPVVSAAFITALGLALFMKAIHGGM